MKHETSFLKRCFALFLALLMAVSGSNLGVALRVSAAESGVEVNVGKLVADNYELTEAEKALLSSGYLTGETVSYTVPTNGAEHVTVDTENKKITANVVDGWVPTVARIMVGTELKETVELTDGVGTYAYAENAFSVEVDYVLDVAVKAELQENLLKAPAMLKDGLDNMKAAYDGTDSTLGTVVLAMDTLKQMAAGITMDFGGFSMTAKFGADAINAVNSLSKQISANGELTLQTLNTAYAAAASKVQFLEERGAEYKAAIDQAYADLAAIKNDPLANNDILDSYLQGSDPSSYTAWKAFKGIVANLVAALEPVTAADWAVLEADVLKAELNAAEYAALDLLVADLGETTELPAIKGTLHVADTTLVVNMSMFNVVVCVELMVVENVVDSNNLVTVGTKAVTLTLAEGATADEILAAVAENGVEADALAAWTEYVAEHFEATKTAVPETLTEDIVYTITYAPKTYAVTGDLGEMEVYYGYQLTLPAHTDETKAYDYTVNGEKFAQGTVVTIEGDTVVLRTYGKAYFATDLYTVIADNYGNDIAQAILKSGALKGNTALNVRKPDPADAESLLELLDGVVTAKNYDAAYAGLVWAPYTYGAEGTENLFGGNTASWSEKAVKVQYMLNLTNIPVAEVASILALAETLKAEAADQKTTLDGFAANKAAMGQLDKTKLGALNGVIDVTDFSEDAEKNAELRAYFKGLVSGIIANNLDTNNYLKIYNMLGEYETDGLKYYYENYDAFIGEIESLAGYLGGMLADQEKVDALQIMVSAAGFPEYADKIVDLEAKLAEVLDNLSAPNAAIDLNSANLGKLLTALSAEGEVVCAEAGHPYLLSEMLTAMDESQVMIQVIIETPKGGATITSAAMDRGTVLTEAIINDLVAKVNAKAVELLGKDNVKFYTGSVEGTVLEKLIGTELNKTVNTYYIYNPTVYYANIAGEASQKVTIEDLEINLPKHPTAGWRYEYTVDGVSGITASTYTFTAEQLERLFASNGLYTITRVAINEANEKMEAAFADWAVKDENGNVVALNAAIAADQNGLMDFVNVMLNAGYSYIGLNGQGLLYMNAEDTLEISLQTLIDAMLNDNDFGSETLIALGKNGGGKMITADMQLGNSAEEAVTVPFTLSLSSVPGIMATVSNGLAAVRNYMSFNANNGELDIKLNLPEKVYEVYLTALLITGEVDKTDITAVNTEIAFMFLYDYLDIITETDATTASYTNTLKMLGLNADLTGYEGYYQMLKKALTYEGLVINSVEGDGLVDISMTAMGQKAIDGLIGLLGVNVSAYEQFLGMIKEYKPGNEVSITINPSLKNAGTAFEAAVIDVKAVKGDVKNVFDYTTDLVAKAKTIKGEAVIMLLGNVDGDLIFNDTTILDLNGYTINGNVVSKGGLYIVDSTLDTYTCGSITGTVSGNVKIVAGNYNVDVSAYLPEGYEQVGTSVRNALYAIEADAAGNLAYVINTDVMEENGFDIKYLAVEIAVDMAMNYFTAAALSFDGNYLYHIDIYDLIGLIDSTNKVDELINRGLACVDVPGIAEIANLIMADMLNFAGIENAVANNEALANHTISIAPWAVVVSHNTNGDYITFGIASNADRAKTYDVALKLEGDNKAYVQKMAGALADIVVAEGTYVKLDLEQPVYADKTLTVVGGAVASAEIDLTVDKNYNLVLGVIMAYGNPEQADALVDAMNRGNVAALKAVFDAMTVKDVFDALKAMNRATSFTAMAEAVGVTVNVADAAKLESVFHLIMIGAGKALEVLDITGYDSKLGNLDKDGDGIYEFSATAKRNGDVSARGYAVDYTVTEVSISLTVHLFGNNCIVGDVNHDGKIDILDLIELRQILADDSREIICEYCADVDQNGTVDILDVIALRLYLAN